MQVTWVQCAGQKDAPEVSYLKNQLTDTEKQQGWKLLWDGATNTGWRGIKSDHFPEKGWTMTGWNPEG